MYYVSHNADRLPLSIHNINIIIYNIHIAHRILWFVLYYIIYLYACSLCAPLVFGRHFFTTSLNFKCLSQYNNNVCGCVRGVIREATVYAVGRLGRYCAFHFDETLIAGKDTLDGKNERNTNCVFAHTGHLVIRVDSCSVLTF